MTKTTGFLGGALGAALFACGAIGGLSGAAVAKDGGTLFPRADTFTLDNGMQVVVIEDHRAPVVTHMVWYRVGAADEPPGESGVAHFLEHLMFKGTDEIPVGAFSKIVARNGGQDNAFTSHDTTAYFQRIARDRLALVMEMEADRMTDLVLTDEIVLPERDVVLEERSQRTDNDPSSILSEQLFATLYRAHPYGTPVIGWRDEIAALTREDAISFYKTYYAPNNAVLVVAGDVTADELRPLAEKFYGVIPRGPEITRARPSEPPHVAPRRVSLVDERVTTPSLRRVYYVPSYTTAEDGEAEALDVLGQILAGGATSRLYRSLVVDQQIAESTFGYYNGNGLDNGTFMVGGVPVDEASLETLEAAIDAEIARIAETGVTDEELVRAVENLVASAIYAQDSQTTMARIYGWSLMVGQSIDDIVSWPERMRAVTAEQVQAAASRYLDMKASVTGLLIPAARS